MRDEYEIVWKEGSLFSKEGWVLQKKDSGEVFIAYFIIAALVFFVVCIAVMTLALIGPLFVIWQMHKRLRYVGGIVGIIGFIYFLIDLQKEWISSVLFYGRTNDDGEFIDGLLGEGSLVYFWFINFAGLGINIFLIVQYFLNYKNLKAEIITEDNRSKDKIPLSSKDESVDVFEKSNEKFVLIKNTATIINGVYFIEDEGVFKNEKSLGYVSGFSGWGGLAESLGIKNAQKKIAKKAKQINANIVLIKSFSEPWGGVKIEGEAYKIKI